MNKIYNDLYLMPVVLNLFDAYTNTTLDPGLSDEMKVYYSMRLINLAEGIGHNPQQILIDEFKYLGTFRMHDAVKAKIKIGLVELKEFLEFFEQTAAKLFGSRHYFFLWY